MKFSRFRVGAAAAALAAAASVLVATPPAQAASSSFTPSQSDWSNCPTLPAGSVKLLWNCIALTLTGTSFKIGNLPNISFNNPITLDAAVGVTSAGKVATIMGGGGGSTGIGSVGSLTSVSLKISLAGPIQFTNGIVPTDIPIALSVSNPLIGTCDIGDPSDPIHLNQLSVTGLALTSIGGNTVATGNLSDDTLSIPGVSNCGLLNFYGSIINLVVGLPAASGKNAISTTPYIQVRNYALGLTTAAAAAAAVK